MKIEYKNTKGFSLVELLVVIASFVIVVVSSISLFVSMISHQRKVLAEQELLSQTSYVTEYMSRALRMATKATDSDCIPEGRNYYAITTPGAPWAEGIRFINASNNDTCQEFILNIDTGRVEEIKDDGQAVPLTAESLNINAFNVKIYGDTADDDTQPRVVIAIDVERQIKDFQLRKHLQVTVSQRNLDE